MNEFINTSDLYCGAFILGRGGLLDRVKIEHPRRGKPSVSFVFKEAAASFKEYQSGRAMINVFSFKVAMTHLKDVMFSQIRESEEKERQRNENQANKRKE